MWRCAKEYLVSLISEIQKAANTGDKAEIYAGIEKPSVQQ